MAELPVTDTAFFPGMSAFLGVAGAAFCWYFFRLPHGNLMFITCAALSAALLHAHADFKARLRFILIVVGCGGALQFLIGMLAEQKFLQLLVPGLFAWGVLRRCEARAAMVAVTVGYIGIGSPGGLIPVCDRWMGLIFAGGSVLCAVQFVKLFEPFPSTAPPDRTRFTGDAALRRAGAIVLGCFLYRFFRMSEGNVMVLTICLLYSGLLPGSDHLKLAMYRFYGTALGFVWGFFYLSNFTYFNYQWIYLLPFWAGFGFYLYYRTGIYWLFTALFMMTLTLFVDFNQGNASANLGNLFFGRLAATALGALLVLLCETLLLPGAAEEKIA